MKQVCTGCGETKELAAFSKHPKGKNGRNPKCKSCKNDAARQYYERNKDTIKLRPDRQRPYSKRHEIKRKYGLSWEEYKALPKICQICGSTEKLVIDHCHSSGFVRGMLCSACNLGLGHFQDDVQKLHMAIVYLGRSAVR